MKHINTGKAEILLVKVPESAKFVHVKENSVGQYLQYSYTNEDGKNRIDTSDYLPKVQEPLLGSAWELTEEQWKEILPCLIYSDNHLHYCHAYLRSHDIHNDNPFGSSEPKIEEYESEKEYSECLEIWKSGEEMCGNWIVLIKVKEE